MQHFRSYVVATALLGVSQIPSAMGFAPPLFALSIPKTSALHVMKKTDADPQFKSLTRGFNQRWIAGSCRDVYLIKTADEARQALDTAVADHYDEETRGGIKIKSGGHCYEDFVTNDDTKVILDVSAMKEWGYDENKDEGGYELGYYLSAGDTNWGAFEKLYKEENKVLPGGSCYSVGLGGHISGGGDGIMSRLYGCTVDVLTGVEMVVKDDVNAPARVIYVGDNSTDLDEQALFWSSKGGGGGNFGIITKYYFKELPDAPVGAIMSNIAFKWSDLSVSKLKEILDWYVRFARKDDNRASSGKFPISHSAAGESVMLLHTAYFDNAGRTAAINKHHEWEDDLAKIINTASPTAASAGHGVGFARNTAPRRKLFRNAMSRSQDEPELSDLMTDLPFYDSTQTMNPSGSTQRGKYKSAYMLKEFPLDQVRTMYNWLTDPSKIPDGLSADEMKQSLIQVDCFAGRINDFKTYDTPIAQRNYLVKCQFQTYWSDEDKDGKHLEWIRGFYNDMYKESGNCPDPAYVDPKDGKKLYEGCYYNYPDVDLNLLDGGVGEKALELYFLDNYKKNDIPNVRHNLYYVKGRWDPYNIFNHRQSIPVPPEKDPYKK